MQDAKVRRGCRSSTVIAVILGLVCLAVFFWPPAPSQRYWHKTVWHVTQADMIPAEQAREQAQAIVRQAQQMWENGTLTPEKMLELDTQFLYIDRHNEMYGPQPRRGVAFYLPTTDQGNLAQVRRNLLTSSKYRGINWSKMMDDDPKWGEVHSFWPMEEHSNAGAVTLRYSLRYALTIPIGFLMFVVLLLGEGRSLVHAIVEAFSYRVSLLFYPLTAPFYAFDGFEYDSHHKQQARKLGRHLVRAAGCVTAAAVSIFCGGNALAQVVKKPGNEKKSKGFSLQLDTRVIDPVSAAPETLFNRTTFQTEHVAAQAITTFTPKTGDYYSEVGGGLKLNWGHSALWLDSYVINSSGAPRKITAGGQYFRLTPRMLIAVPDARMEIPRDGPKVLFLYANPFFRLARDGIGQRLAIVPDLQFKKVFGGPRTWSLGAGFAVFHRKGKNDRLELAAIRNSVGAWQLRSRYIVGFAF